MNTLIVVTDSPLIWRSASSSAASTSVAGHRHQAIASHTTDQEGGISWHLQADGSESKANQPGSERANKKRSPFSFPSPGQSRNPPPSWSAHPREAASLLSLLFSWANSGGDDGEGAGGPISHANRGVPAVVVAEGTESDTVNKSEALDPKSLLSDLSSPKAAESEGGKSGRTFSIVCPATRVRMNLETYVKDRDTGRVAVQWCLASKDTGEIRRARC